MSNVTETKIETRDTEPAPPVIPAGGASAAVDDALAVMVTDRRHLAWLRDNDPKALEQATRALREAGYELPALFNVDTAEVPR